MTTPPFVGRPSRADLFAWLGQSDMGDPGDEYDLALDVALEQQAVRCDVTWYGPALHGAALRRAARWLAMRGHSLGALGNADLVAYVPRWDAGIEEAEADYRWGGFA